jgi:dsRNA-specific ribonuclease
VALLDRALTHASRANEADAEERRDNEPLEFLGDAVLGLTVTDLLHRLDPEGSEGRKSRRRAALVSAPSLARRAEALGLPALLRLGRGRRSREAARRRRSGPTPTRPCWLLSTWTAASRPRGAS